MDKIWFPMQRALRTAAAVLVTLTSALAVAVVVAPQILTAVQDVLPGPVVAWASGAIAAVAALSAALSRLMAVPWVNEQLTKIGLGTTPRTAVAVTFESGEAVGMTRRQLRAHLGTNHTPPDRIVKITEGDTTVS
ncbi:MAG: hypothetical protein LBE05_05665 [Microbacterium sp.]|jgi:hypothetical protein|nr:hypothetical protein [Microbacterium sp.]